MKIYFLTIFWAISAERDGKGELFDLMHKAVDRCKNANLGLGDLRPFSGLINF